MALTLTVTDNADGSGATATITGTLGAAVTVYTQPAAGGAFTAAGTRTGDGALAIPGLGYFWGYAQDAGGISNVVYWAATESAKAVADRCADALVAILQGLIFTPLAGGSAPVIARQLTPNIAQTGQPAWIVSLEGKPESPVRPFTSETEDEVGYGLWLRLVAHSDANYQGNTGTFLLWRQQAMRATRHRKLTGVPEVYSTRIEPAPAVDPALQAYQKIVSGFVVRCLSVEGRV